MRMRFGITSNAKNRNDISQIRKVLKLLRRKGHDLVIEKNLGKILKEKNVPKRSTKYMDVDMILSVGDTFNVLKTFRELGGKRIPVLGVSTTQAGFLCDIGADQFETALPLIEKSEYVREERSRLSLEVDGKKIDLALNDAVVTPRKSSIVISYSLVVNGKTIWKDMGDGVIISTPTGSTGYSLSAGGPVTFPDSRVFVVTPICSLNQNKAVVLDDDSVIEIKSISCPGGCEVVVDGQMRARLDGETLKISKASVPAYFVKFEGFGKNVLEKLTKRMERTGIMPAEAPPSAKFIYKILQYEDHLTQQEIIKTTSLPPRTVRSALTYLLKNNLIAQQTSLRDARHSIYYLK